MEHGAGGNAWIMDRNAKHKLRALSLSLLEEDQEIHVPRLLTPEKAAKEAAKEDQLVMLPVQRWPSLCPMLCFSLPQPQVLPLSLVVQPRLLSRLPRHQGHRALLYSSSDLF
ncbi:unnamed protein product [Urochloa humidicola]